MDIISAAWKRWQRFQRAHHGSVELDVKAKEAQYELVALGLTLHVNEVQDLFIEDARVLLSLLTPLPTALTDLESVNRFHFTLVASTILLDDVTTDVVLPLLTLERHALLHQAALNFLRILLETQTDQEAIQKLFTEVYRLLREHRDSEITYNALCRLLELLQRRGLQAVDMVQICKLAINNWSAQPRFLRALVLYNIPTLLDTKDGREMHGQLLELVLDAWNPREMIKSPKELLYLVCVILSKASREVIASAKFQQLVCFALRHNDALVRKQGIQILKLALMDCSLDKELIPPDFEWEMQETCRSTWQKFLTASEVVQVHHEPHLIEQVWPQIAELLVTNLVVYNESKKHLDWKEWPIQFTFDWMQSLLLRLFAHDNPAVKRLFMSNFMKTCLECWDKTTTSSTSIDATSSFTCLPNFQLFVFQDLLRACNDPVLYKNAHRARFQVVVSRFLATFLAFQIVVKKKKHVLDDFVFAVNEAIFGKNVTSHSPEALLSLLQVFQSLYLMHKAIFASCEIQLSTRAVDQLYILLDVHAMQSFSQAMRSKMLCALTHALTGGFVNASALSLSALARIFHIYPFRILLTDDGATLIKYLSWIKASASVNNSYCFSNELATAVQRYLQLHAGDNTDDILSPTQLARLMLLTADVESNTEASYLDPSIHRQEVVSRTPLSALLSNKIHNEVSKRRLVILVAKFEAQVQDLEANCPSSQRFAFSFDREAFYSGRFSFSYLFELAMTVFRNWLENVSSKVTPRVEIQEDLTELVTSGASVLVQMSTHQMTLTGHVHDINRLDALCEELKDILAAAADQSIFNVALAATCLSIVGSNASAVDSLRAFETERLLPLLLSLDTSRRFKGKTDARCAITLAASKWDLLHQVVASSSFISTKLLRDTFDTCINALPIAGMDPLALIPIINVLKLTLSQLAGTLMKAFTDATHVDTLLETVWTAYNDSKAKPDALTRAVILCIFQPAFLLQTELNGTMKRWIARFIGFGARHRPNVIFHMACRLCQTWRAHPLMAISFIDEVIALLLFKEPVIDEKEQLTMDASTSCQGFQDFPIDNENNQVSAITSHAKDRFVRLVVLSFLEDVAVDTASLNKDMHQLMDALVVRFVRINMTSDWQKPHMLNSDGFGKQLRSWQALCVMSKHVTNTRLQESLAMLQSLFAMPHLPSVRYYMELFAMRMTLRFPREMCSGFLLPMLEDANLMPQASASLLLVSAYLVHAQLDDPSNDVEVGDLLETMLPWLGTSHGYTRALAQYLVMTILPRHIHQLELRGHDTPGLRFLKGTAQFLSTNKDSKRLRRRQARQLEDFYPNYECSLLGMLSSGFISEFGELLPRDDALCFRDQLQTAMNELYAQYQLEHYPSTSLQQKSSNVTMNNSWKALKNVQRKIDTTTLLLDERVLPLAMRFDVVHHGDSFNARERPRQPIIMCASLVDKIPNLAGLARTCEILNAQKLIVPNLRLIQEDRTFASVSATAHKWIPLEEVRPQGKMLQDALVRWKSEGYSIVAVEQTTSSVSLVDYMLPRKMVLVLGCEKEGIPLEILQLVDVCVEIPQFGLVRSLNVHVSGALVLWEYTQQQLMTKGSRIKSLGDKIA
ncbi:hypothetical protein CCR75_007349 [Bremia lactucae]|uniref:tRNA/rRNA methyltransferase SpoU type domain-containing protein n=1 Tax=Bremia lactucae TaxID=4779 RepID=A0A976FQL5_BRELC|nr:hypothetical protein CCR75_007349 [Bremia lactucae]